METLAIDLPTVIRMVDASSPVVGIARARVREADARRLRAELQWLPNLSVGAAYLRFDGQTQNQRGEVFGVSRSNLFASGGPALTVDLADAIYQPLIERRVVSAEQLRTRAVTLGAELDAIEAYLELLQAHALIEINADTTRRAEEMLKAATNARDAKLDRTAGDVNRARTEVLLRKSERAALDGRAGVAAAWARFRKSDRGFLLPKLVVADQVGSFGGGRNDDLQDFEARNAPGRAIVLGAEKPRVRKPRGCRRATGRLRPGAARSGGTASGRAGRNRRSRSDRGRAARGARAGRRRRPRGHRTVPHQHGKHEQCHRRKEPVRRVATAAGD